MAATTLPRDEDYTAVEHAIDAAHGELERLVWRLEAVLEDDGEAA